jgi:hypothetical protein
MVFAVMAQTKPFSIIPVNCALAIAITKSNSENIAKTIKIKLSEPLRLRYTVVYLPIEPDANFGHFSRFLMAQFINIYCTIRAEYRYLVC